MSITSLMASQNSIAKLSLPKTQIHRSHHLQQSPAISCFPMIKPTVTHYMITTRTTVVKWKPMIPYASGDTAGTPQPSSSGGGSWKNWVIGILMTFIVPLVTTKGGPVKTLLQKVDKIMDTAEHITEVVEAVADKVDKVIEDIEDELPEGTQIRKTLDFIESVAERVEKDANTVDEFIDKVQEMEDKIEEEMAPLLEEAKTIDRETKERNKANKV